MDRRFAIIITLIVGITSTLRAAGIFNDFWLDEIWSYNIARNLHRPFDVLLSPEARIDNNHPLNTLVLWLLGEQRRWWAYRVPSLLAGIGTVIVTIVIAMRRGRSQAVLATLLVGFSYPLVFYSSEARGYALVVFFALLAFDALERYLARPSWAHAAYFAGSCVLGVLSHLTFIHFYAGALAWAAYRLTRARGLRVAVVEMLRLHAVPVAFCAWIYVIFVRNLTVGGSAPESLPDALAGAITGLLGVHFPPNANLLLATAIFIGLCWTCRGFVTRGSDFWVFLVVAMIVSPALLLGRQYLILPPERQQPIASRYFLVLLPFFLLAVSAPLASLLGRRESYVARVLVLTSIAAFLALQLNQTFRFLAVGRGHYSDAVLYMAEHSPSDQPVTVISDHYYRTQMVLDFYRRVLPAGREMQTYDGTGRLELIFERGAPQWAIRHFNIPNSPPAPAYSVLDVAYLYDREFPYYGLSGYCWYVYRRKD